MNLTFEALTDLLFNSMRSCELKAKNLPPYWQGVIDGQHDLCLELLEKLGASEIIKNFDYINRSED